MKPILATAAAALALAGCTTMTDGASRGASASAPMATDAMGYMRMAGASDQYEIQSSRLVLETTQNADLRRYAQMMIDHHTMTTQQLASAAQAAGMTPPPPQLDAQKADMIAQLRAATGAARDRLYVRQQVMAHEEALALHSGYAKSGDAAQLRQVAATATPIVQQHLDEVRRMDSRMG